MTTNHTPLSKDIRDLLRQENAELRQRVEALTILAEGCPQHSSYRAKKFVTTTCPRCNLMIEARKVLAKLDGHHQEGEGGSAG